MKLDTKMESEALDVPSTPSSKPPPTPDRAETKKKKKGLFGGLFGKKGKKSERSGSRTRGLKSPMSRKGKGVEGSI